jgi:hypothetical protein
MSVADPWTVVVAYAAASAWAHARRVRGIGVQSARTPISFAASVLPFGLGWGLLRAVPPGTAWLAMGMVLAAVVVVVRAVHSEDPFWAPWLAATSGTVTVGIAATWYAAPGISASPWSMAGAAGLAAVVLAGIPRWPVARVWMASGAGAVALAVALDGAGTSALLLPAIWASVGLGAVAVAGVWGRSVAGHLAAVGHLVGIGSLLAPASSAVRAFTLAAWSAGWLVAVIADEHGRISVRALVTEQVLRLRVVDPVDVGRATAILPSTVLALSTPVTLMVSLALWGRFAATPTWAGLALGVLAVVYAASARRWEARRPLARVLAVGAIAVAVFGVASAVADPWPTVGAATASIAVAIILGPRLGEPGFRWFAWLMSGVVVVVLAERTGVPVRMLHTIAFAWATVLLVGGLALDDLRAGRRRRGQGIRISWLWPAVVLGALAVAASLWPTFTQGPRVVGWWSLAASAVYLVAAVQLRAGAVTVPAYALATVGVSALGPWSPMEQPAILAGLAAVLVGGSLAMERLGGVGVRAVWLRWDLPPLVVAHLVAAFALSRAAAIGSLAATWTAFGVLSLIVAAWRRRRAWAEGGNVLVLVGAGAAGGGWLAAALLATALRGMVSAVVSTGWSRTSYHGIGVAAAAWAWVEIADWQLWTSPELVANSALAFGGLAAAVGVLARFARLPRDWTFVWGGLATVGAANAALGFGYTDSLLPALGMGLFAVGAGLAVRPLAVAGLEALAPAAVGMGWLHLIAGVPWNIGQALVYTSLAGGALALVVAGLARLAGLSRPWSVSWGGLALVALVLVGVSSSISEGAARIDGPATATGAAMFAVACAIAARPVWPPLHNLAIIATAWAWIAAAVGLGWSTETSVVATALAFGGIAVAAVELGRLRAGRPQMGPPAYSTTYLARIWTYLGTAGVVVAIDMATGLPDRRPAWSAIAVGLGLLAIAAARGPRALSWPWLREVAGLLALGALTVLGHALELTTATIAVAAITVGAVTALLALSIWGRAAASPWLRPLALAGIGASIEAAVIAVATWPEPQLLAAAFLVLGGQATAAGYTLRRPATLAIAPILLLGAWLSIGAESLAGDPQWYTTPVAIAMVAEVEIARWANRLASRVPSTPQLLVLEWVALAVLALPPLTSMFTHGLGFAAVAVTLAASTMLWGVLTRVRRRVIAGAVLAAATAVLIIAAAVAGQAPASARFWIVLASVGFTVMLVVAIIEAYRSRTGRIMGRLDQLMAGWEA